MANKQYIPVEKDWHSFGLNDEEIHLLANFFYNRMEEFDDAIIRTVTFNTSDFDHLKQAGLGNFEVTLQRIKKFHSPPTTEEMLSLYEWRGVFTRGLQYFVMTGYGDWE